MEMVMKTGVELIAEERKRQIEKEGFSSEHDDEHHDESLPMAAALYAAPIKLYRVIGCGHCNTVKRAVDPWPWHRYVDPPRGGPHIRVTAWDKREEHDRLHQLVIAGALIAAEIDRLQRLGYE